MDELESVNVDLENACLDFVTERANEADVRTLLTAHQAGEWVSLDRVRRIAAPVSNGAGRFDASGVFVTWLPDPSGDSSFVLIIFFDDCSKWSTAAQYNRSRILRPGTKPSQELGAPQGAVVP